MFRKDFLDTSEFDICSTLESKMGLEIKLILADMRLVRVVLYVILGRYFGMISRNFGMKIYYYLLF